MNTSSALANSHSFNKPNINLDSWVETMRKSICEHEDEEITKIPVSIFTVPKVLLATDPNSYIPQQVALGPFHHWRPEVYDMQKYKLAAARRTQKYMNISFDRLVEIMKQQDEARIRACYHKYIDMSSDALIWMMAVDMAFLLEFLVVYSMKAEGRTHGNELVASAMSHLVDVTGNKMSHVEILRDIVMLENQIPLFLIKKMLEHHHRANEVNKSPGERLKTTLLGLYRELSPFREEKLADVSIDECDHILDFLYHMTVPDHKELRIYNTIDNDSNQQEDGSMITVDVDDTNDKEFKSFAKASHLKWFKDCIWGIISKSNAGIMKVFSKIILSKPMEVIMKVPWKIITTLPILKLLKEPIEEMLDHLRGQGTGQSKEDSGDEKAPTIEEIKIPSVTEMVKAGIFFSPVKGGISDISFDVKTSTLYLPVVDLDVNTEVYLRNLVAYEACIAAGPLVVARYTELMNGIIDTEEDAKYLREQKIVKNHLNSDQEVADLWNGMSKSIKMTKVEKLDKVIEDVNKRYAKTWRVKLAKFMRTYVFASWKILTLLAALFMLFLTTVQAICSVYSCARVFHQLPEIPEGGAE